MTSFKEVSREEAMGMICRHYRTVIPYEDVEEFIDDCEITLNLEGYTLGQWAEELADEIARIFAEEANSMPETLEVFRD